jgi:uncharacterized protein YbjT (DUF2867 family)
VKLVVLGASGGIGQWVVRTAAKAGHSVTAVGRRTSLIPAVPGVLQRRGEITDPAFLEEAIDGHSIERRMA